jgi:hypothetical protein
MSSSTSNSKAAETSKADESAAQEVVPTVGVLEEDDEFEEFATAGALPVHQFS